MRVSDLRSRSRRQLFHPLEGDVVDDLRPVIGHVMVGELGAEPTAHPDVVIVPVVVDHVPGHIAPRYELRHGAMTVAGPLNWGAWTQNRRRGSDRLELMFDYTCGEGRIGFREGRRRRI